jgi:hypothetical protein
MIGDMAEPAPLLILTAVLAEARTVAAALGTRCPAIGVPVRLEDGDRTVELHLIGIRGRHLPSGLNEAGVIVLAGLAGGLDPAAAVGDLVIEGWPGPLPSGFPARQGRIICSEQLVSTPEQKADLFAATGGMAVDMESDAVRRAAGNVPVVHVRAISDAAGDSINPAMLTWVDPIGRPRPGALAMGLLRRPMVAAELAKLARNVRIATRALAAAMPRIVAGM